jgi:hypothetical protein
MTQPTHEYGAQEKADPEPDKEDLRCGDCDDQAINCDCGVAR